MRKEHIIDKTINFVRKKLEKAEGGHDWWHVYRVWNNSKKILKNTPKADELVVELGALLHDIADSKFNNGDENIGPRTAKKFLLSLKIKKDIIDHVENILKNISFKESLDETKSFKSLELSIVQDADRLDALGAIGIARAFNYGGYMNRLLYSPEVKPRLNMTKLEYKSHKGTTINHFYEKLLTLKDLMNTKEGKKIAKQRHKFLEEYLSHFYSEWNGN